MHSRLGLDRRLRRTRQQLADLSSDTPRGVHDDVDHGAVGGDARGMPERKLALEAGEEPTEILVLLPAGNLDAREAAGDLRIGLHRCQRITGPEHDHGAFDLVGQELQQVQRRSLLVHRACQQVVDLVDHDHPRRNLAQQREGGELHGSQPVARPVRRVERHQQLTVQPTFLRCRRHLNRKHVHLQETRLGVELACRMRPQELLNDHRLADVGLAMNQQPRHAGALR